MQGVTYINSAKFWWARLIWCFMLLVAFVAMSLHLWYLVNQYMSYPVQTKISLGFETLTFPQVTICNTNVMHRGRLDEYDKAEKLKELLDNLHPENLVPDQFDPDYDPFAPKNPPPPGGPKDSGKPGQTGPPQKGPSSSGQQESSKQGQTGLPMNETSSSGPQQDSGQQGQTGLPKNESNSSGPQEGGSKQGQTGPQKKGSDPPRSRQSGINTGLKNPRTVSCAIVL